MVWAIRTGEIYYNYISGRKSLNKGLCDFVMVKSFHNCIIAKNVCGKSGFQREINEEKRFY